MALQAREILLIPNRFDLLDGEADYSRDCPLSLRWSMPCPRLVTSLVVLLAPSPPPRSLRPVRPPQPAAGYVKVEQQARFPAPRVTRHQPRCCSARLCTADAEGTPRIINLPPGEYVLTVELAWLYDHTAVGVLLAARPASRSTSA